MQNCKAKKSSLKKFFAWVLIILALVFVYFSIYVNPQIVKTNMAQIKAYTNSVINNAILGTLKNNDYDNLISIQKDTDGNVVLLSVNSTNSNNLINNINSQIQNTLNSQNSLNYYLPLGTFTGIPLLAGIGPKIKLNIVPIGSVQTAYKSQIASISINQSYHKIYITIKTSICVVLPLYTQTILISNQVLVAENIIVGKIPDTYLNTDNLTNALNLIP